MTELNDFIIEQLKDVNHDIDQISNIFGEIVEYN